MDQEDVRELLQGELSRRSRANPRYSLRSFARFLDHDPSVLSKILKGRRPVGKRLAAKFTSKLGVPTEKEAFHSVSLDTFQVISDWQHYAILELMRVRDFRPDRAWIAHRLRLTVPQVNAAIERLVRVGLLEIRKDGKWVDLSQEKTTTIDNEFTHAAFRNMQQQLLQKALAALEEVPMPQRDHTSMTMAIDASRLPLAKKKIKKFRREMAELLSQGGKRDEVYNLSIAFYPMTNLKEEM